MISQHPLLSQDFRYSGEFDTPPTEPIMAAMSPLEQARMDTVLVLQGSCDCQKLVPLPRGSEDASIASPCCILYCEFDPDRGPRLVYQDPPKFVSSEIAEHLSDHLVTSSDLCGQLVSVAAFGLRFVGHPVHIKDTRYPRNQLIFSVCFVFEACTDPRPFHDQVRRVAEEFRTLEMEHRLLLNQIVCLRCDIVASPSKIAAHMGTLDPF